MFGVVLPSRPVLGPPALQTVAENQFAYTFPAAPAFSHLVVFLLPDNTLPLDVLAGIYIQFPPKDATAPAPEFRLLGALSADKQSAIFRVNAPKTLQQGQGQGHVIGEIGGVAEVDMDAETEGGEGMAQSGNVTVGISIEPAATLQSQLAALQQQQQRPQPPQQQQLQLYSPASASGNQGAGAAMAAPAATKDLAQKIIKNAFNFLSGFAGADGKVSLKSFEDWWRKFQSRLEADPGFLERTQDD